MKLLLLQPAELTPHPAGKRVMGTAAISQVTPYNLLLLSSARFPSAQVEGVSSFILHPFLKALKDAPQNTHG